MGTPQTFWIVKVSDQIQVILVWLVPCYSVFQDSQLLFFLGDNILMCKRVDVNFDADADQILVALPGLSDSTLTKKSSEPSSMGSALVFEYEVYSQSNICFILSADEKYWN